MKMLLAHGKTLSSKQSVLSVFDSHQLTRQLLKDQIRDILYFSGTVLYHPYNTYSVVYSLARRESELIYCILNKELTWELIRSLCRALLILELTKWVRLGAPSMTICWLLGPIVQHRLNYDIKLHSMTSRDPPMTIRSDDPGSLSSLTVGIILIEKKAAAPLSLYGKMILKKIH